MTTVVCVKVNNIRPKYNNLKEWMEDKNNVYIGRKGIVFINGSRFPNRDSLWANEFKLNKELKDKEERKKDLNNVLLKYELKLKEKLKTGKIKPSQLLELDGKNLGCWCKEKGNEPCHGDIILKYLNKLREYIKENKENKLDLDKILN